MYSVPTYAPYEHNDFFHFRVGLYQITILPFPLLLQCSTHCCSCYIVVVVTLANIWMWRKWSETDGIT